MDNGNTFINILILLIKQINTLILYVQGEELGYVQDHFKMNVMNSTLVSLQAFIGLLVFFWGGVIFFNFGLLLLLSFLYSFNYGSGIEQRASSTLGK